MSASAGTKLFGTDGVRGKVGEFLTAELAFALGRALVTTAGKGGSRVLVVRDTRVSGEMLESALCAGIAAAGGHVFLAGVLPTAAASLLVRRLSLDFGAVISASHNPYEDNGIKFFDATGHKLSDEAEAAVERAVEEGAHSEGSGTGRVQPLAGALDDYLREIGSRHRSRVDGLRVVLDCANGAAYRAAPLIFERLGAEVEAIYCEPDGTNINAGCGSTHLEPLREAVVHGGHDVGFAFDGDADRVLAVDRNGTTVDGDEMVAIAAVHLKEQGELAGNGVAVTIMTNYGFHRAMQEAGIEVVTTQVGDRYVVEELGKRGWTIGGEQSGHIIDMRLTPSGDGISAALLLLEALGGHDLADNKVMQKLPQCLENVAVQGRNALANASGVRSAIESESARLEGRGRVLVRPSGTEPVVRVMVEAPSESECKEICGRLVERVRRELGPAAG
jgi:phosphoglucosamine mutase